MDTLTFARLGALLNSALFLIGVFIAALVFGHRAAAFLALASAGVAFLSYAVGALIIEDCEAGLEPAEMAPAIAFGFLVLSIVLGAVAGFALLF